MNLNSRVNTFLTMRGDRSAKLSTQPWADTNTTKGCVADTVRKIKQMVPLVQRKMQLYLANRETEFILFRPVSLLVYRSKVAVGMVDVLTHFICYTLLNDVVSGEIKYSFFFCEPSGNLES